MKTGKRSAGKPHAAFDEAGAGNVATGAGLRPKAKAMEPPPDPTEPARQFSTRPSRRRATRCSRCRCTAFSPRRPASSKATGRMAVRRRRSQAHGFRRERRSAAERPAPASPPHRPRRLRERQRASGSPRAGCRSMPLWPPSSARRSRALNDRIGQDAGFTKSRTVISVSRGQGFHKVPDSETGPSDSRILGAPFWCGIPSDFTEREHAKT